MSAGEKGGRLFEGSEMVKLVKSAGESASASSTSADASPASLFFDIAILALQVDSVLSAATLENRCPEIVFAAVSLAGHIGYLADLGAERSGAARVKGGAEDWMASAKRCTGSDE
jgi:hypothetical protein